MARTRNQGSKWCRRDFRLALYLRDGFQCCYCGATVEDGVEITLDHVVPCELTPRPDNSASNLVTCCGTCNSSRQDKTLRAWYAELRARGVDTGPVAARIRRQLAKDLKPFREEAKTILARRGSWASVRDDMVAIAAK